MGYDYEGLFCIGAVIVFFIIEMFSYKSERAKQKEEFIKFQNEIALKLEKT